MSVSVGAGRCHDSHSTAAADAHVGGCEGRRSVPGQHRGSEQDLKQMAEVAKYVNSWSTLLQEPSLTAFPSCESWKVCCNCLPWKQPCCCK